MRRFLLVALALMLATGLMAGCSASDGGDTTEPATGNIEGTEFGSSAEKQAGGEVTIETFEAWLAEQPDTDAWYPKATSTEMTTRLRKPMILIFVDMRGVEIGAYIGDVGREWANSEQSQTTGLRIVSRDGMVFTPFYTWSEAGVSVPPASADEFMAWLDQAYGPASGDPVDEAWYGRIQSAGLNAERGAIEVKTDLDYDSPTDQELADVIAEVLRMSWPAGVSGWIVRFGDGDKELSSGY